MFCRGGPAWPPWVGALSGRGSPPAQGGHAGPPYRRTHHFWADEALELLQFVLLLARAPVLGEILGLPLEGGDHFREPGFEPDARRLGVRERRQSADWGQLAACEVRPFPPHQGRLM